jgi:hypothetical protein
VGSCSVHTLITPGGDFAMLEPSGDHVERANRSTS